MTKKPRAPDIRIQNDFCEPKYLNWKYWKFVTSRFRKFFSGKFDVFKGSFCDFWRSLIIRIVSLEPLSGQLTSPGNSSILIWLKSDTSKKSSGHPSHNQNRSKRLIFCHKLLKFDISLLELIRLVNTKLQRLSSLLWLLCFVGDNGAARSKGSPAEGHSEVWPNNVEHDQRLDT